MVDTVSVSKPPKCKLISLHGEPIRPLNESKGDQPGHQHHQPTQLKGPLGRACVLCLEMKRFMYTNLKKKFRGQNPGMSEPVYEWDPPTVTVLLCSAHHLRW